MRKKEMSQDDIIYTYKLSDCRTQFSYDEAMMVACLQGIINRDAARAYITSERNNRPQAWFNLFSSRGEWLHGKPVKALSDLEDLVDLAKEHLKGVVIWDPEVPATVNVATTIAGIKDGVVLNPELAEEYLARWNLSFGRLTWPLYWFGIWQRKE
jgi:hypothetical protein